MVEPVHGFSDTSDEEFVAQVEALMDLPLEQRLQGLAAAEEALRERLGSANVTVAATPSDGERSGAEDTAHSE
ncbi:hypothetical protein C3B54_111183 [Pontimonas salivibrio]|uniref:Uncharacterized protein n=1 Tax=Pontimonas salivibrio TaxID=1159327 RepID=A0A2L2BRA8_9MICO|nr:hypothetical protein [Pontimonas salivibrio]AVG24142.1 hypothetical protein C3B54_111183 [Pontimonas salivibrio]